jgi:LysR family transcriptional activator of nhaA
MKAFGQEGAGVLISPMAIATENMMQYGVELIGSTDDLCEHFYAISVERKISHPAVAAITETARGWLQ